MMRRSRQLHRSSCCRHECWTLWLLDRLGNPQLNRMSDRSSCCRRDCWRLWLLDRVGNPPLNRLSDRIWWRLLDRIGGPPRLSGLSPPSPSPSPSPSGAASTTISSSSSSSSTTLHFSKRVINNVYTVTRALLEDGVYKGEWKPVRMREREAERTDLPSFTC